MKNNVSYVFEIKQGEKGSVSKREELAIETDDRSKIEDILKRDAEKDGFHNDALFRDTGERILYCVTADDGITVRTYYSSKFLPMAA